MTGLHTHTGIAEVSASDVIGGEVRCNLGYTDTGKGIAAGTPAWFGAPGLIARPNDPDDDGACMVWWVQDGPYKRIFGWRDNRYADKAGELEEGDVALVTLGDARLLIKKGRQSITLYTVDGVNDKDMAIHLDGVDGYIEARAGNSSIRVKNGKITMLADGGNTILTLDSKGMQLDGSNCRLMTQGGCLGSMVPVVPGIPPPIGLNSVLGGPMGMAGVASSKWSVSLAFVFVWIATFIHAMRSS